MTAKRLSLIAITALIPAAASVVLDFLIIREEFRITSRIIEEHNRSLSLVSLLLIILCGAVFILAEVLTWLLMRRRGALERKALFTALLAGAIVYALLMAFLFPCSIDLLYEYLPRSELSPGITLLLFQISAGIAAAVCGIFNAAAIRLSLLNDSHPDH